MMEERGWMKFGQDLEEAGQQRNKVFWSKVKNTRNFAKKQAPGLVLNRSGASQKECVVWNSETQALALDGMRWRRDVVRGRPRRSLQNRPDTKGH